MHRVVSEAIQSTHKEEKSLGIVFVHDALGIDWLNIYENK